MEKPGSMGMMHWGRLFRSRAWQALVPDRDHKIVTEGVGEFWGLDYLAAAAAPDGSLMIAYMPDARPITVDLARLSKEAIKAWWFNPRDGSSILVGIFPPAGPRVFTPPGPRDWVLVADHESMKLRAPGSL
jgi:hypothetical protein